MSRVLEWSILKSLTWFHKIQGHSERLFYFLNLISFPPFVYISHCKHIIKHIRLCLWKRYSNFCWLIDWLLTAFYFAISIHSTDYSVYMSSYMLTTEHLFLLCFSFLSTLLFPQQKTFFCSMCVQVRPFANIYFFEVPRNLFG